MRTVPILSTFLPSVRFCYHSWVIIARKGCVQAVEERFLEVVRDLRLNFYPGSVSERKWIIKPVLQPLADGEMMNQKTGKASATAEKSKCLSVRLSNSSPCSLSGCSSIACNYCPIPRPLNYISMYACLFFFIPRLLRRPLRPAEIP